MERTKAQDALVARAERLGLRATTEAYPTHVAVFVTGEADAQGRHPWAHLIAFSGDPATGNRPKHFASAGTDYGTEGRRTTMKGLCTYLLFIAQQKTGTDAGKIEA